MRASNRINGRSPLRSILRSLVVAALVVSGVAMSIATPAAAAALPYRIDLKVLVLDKSELSAIGELGTGAKDVRIVCLEKREEMPAGEWEIEQAREEGAKILAR